jgi:outer membrane protein assembly factor BamB
MSKTPPVRLALIGGFLAVSLGAACSSGASTPAVRSSTASTTTTAAATTSTTGGSPVRPAPAWPTYHRTNDRRGAVSGLAKPSRLSRAWSHSVDGSVYGQPIVVGNTVIAATENDTVYGLDLATGRRVWQRHVGTPASRSSLPCGNIDPLGITGTPAYDSATGLVFVVAETTGGNHDLFALEPATGAVRFSRNLDVTSRDRKAEQERGALAVANGRVYVPFGGLFGDCGNYVGYVTSIATNGNGAITHYEVPTAREAGIWAASGPATSASGDVFVSVGNGASTSPPYDGSDSVLRVSPDLSRRLDFFAPRDWAAQNASDADLGSTGPLLLPNHLALIAGKAGEIFLLDTDHLGGIGGQLATTTGCTSFGGMAYDGGAAFLPCTDGVLRLDVSGHTLVKRWKVSTNGSPVVGGGAVWSLDQSSGVLDVFDEASGKQITSAPVGELTRFASPVLVGSRVLVGTTNAVVALTVH